MSASTGFAERDINADNVTAYTICIPFMFRQDLALRSLISLWDITPCVSLKIKVRFGAISRLYLQNRRKIRRRNQHQTGRMQSLKPTSSCFILYFSTLKKEAKRSSRNVSLLSTNCTVLYPRRQNSLKHRPTHKATGNFGERTHFAPCPKSLEPSHPILMALLTCKQK